MIYLCRTKSKECMKGESFTELCLERKCTRFRNLCAHDVFVRVNSTFTVIKLYFNFLPDQNQSKTRLEEE